MATPMLTTAVATGIKSLMVYVLLTRGYPVEGPTGQKCPAPATIPKPS